MWWNKPAALLAALLCGSTLAAGVQCPATLQDGGKPHALTNASLFEGPPEQLADLMPDSDNAIRWALPDYQQSARARGTALYLVCRYAKTRQTTTLQVPPDAKSCAVTGGRRKTVAGCG